MRPACFLAGGLAAPARINASNARRHREQHDWLTRAGVHRRRLWSRRKQTICSRWRECARGRARDGKMNQPRRGASCVNALPQSTTAWMSAYSIIGRSCMLSPMPKRGRLPAAMNVLMQSTLPSPIEYGASSSGDRRVLRVEQDADKWVQWPVCTSAICRPRMFLEGHSRRTDRPEPEVFLARPLYLR